MKRSHVIAGAVALDWVVGDPEGWPHPVRWMGQGCSVGERLLSREGEAGWNLVAGAGLTCVLVGGAYLLSAAIIRGSGRVGPVLEVLLGATCLASRSLDDEGLAVIRALEAGDLGLARARLARIVGRDTASLDEAGISRAVIETLAESACDGVLAPLFFLMVGGVPGAMAFKAVSTLDSMIGHQTLRYEYFGKVAARLDDLANLVPARLTAMAILLVKPGRFAVETWARDNKKHASPNAGHPEAAMAGVLGVELGGESRYGGEVHQAPLLNAGAKLPRVADARRALRVTRGVSLIAALAAIAYVAYRTERSA